MNFLGQGFITYMLTTGNKKAQSKNTRAVANLWKTSM